MQFYSESDSFEAFVDTKQHNAQALALMPRAPAHRTSTLPALLTPQQREESSGAGGDAEGRESARVSEPPSKHSNDNAESAERSGSAGGAPPADSSESVEVVVLPAQSDATQRGASRDSTDRPLDSGESAGESAGKEEAEEKSKEDGAFTSRFLLSDEQIAELGIPESQTEVYRRMHYQRSFAVSNWIDTPLGEHTFPTSVVPLSYDEAESILNVHKERASEEDEERLDALRAKIAEELKRYESGAFIKLDTRSPKDVFTYATDNETIKESIRNRLQGGNIDATAAVNAVVIATQEILKVTDADKAMSLLTQSQRVFEDLQKQLAFPRNLFDSKIILRKWNDAIIECPEGEFRCFVNNGKINAITQYYSFVHYPQLVAKARQIKERLVKFFYEQVNPVLSETHDSYVLDLFYDFKTEEVQIVELNPFHIGAGAGLFSWKEDREVFLNGPPNGGCRFRVKSAYASLEEPYNTLPVKWQKWLSEEYGKELEADNEKRAKALAAMSSSNPSNNNSNNNDNNNNSNSSNNNNVNNGKPRTNHRTHSRGRKPSNGGSSADGKGKKKCVIQ